MDDSLIIGGGKDKEEINILDWVVVRLPGTGYIGKVSGAVMSKVAGARTAQQRVEDFKEKVFEILKKNDGWLELSPGYDYSAPMMPMQDQQGRRFFNREPVIVPAEFTTFNTSVSVRPSAIIFVADMNPADRDTYKKFAISVQDTITRMRAQNAVLTLAGPGAPHG